MSELSIPKPVAAAASLVGMAAWAFICFGKAEGPVSAFTLMLFAFTLVPYGFCLLVTLVGPGRPYYGLAGSLGALAGDALTYYSVFVSPSSSTAGLAVIAAPLVNLLLFVPGGMLLGYAIQRVSAKPAAP